VFVGLALLYEDVGQDVDSPIEQLHGFRAMALLVVTFVALILVAAYQVRKRHAERTRRQVEETKARSPVTALE
jgi:hypothetical protein